MTIDKDTLPIEDNIPITYMGGTGGVFLCHLIVSAKENNKHVIDLSTHGNAHENGLVDIKCSVHGIRDTDIDKINFILSQSVKTNAQKPYYTLMHVAELSNIVQYFKKSIRITYDLDDSDELSKIMIAKVGIDSRVLELNDKLNVVKKRMNIKMGFHTYNCKFNKEDYSNVLFISWKELFKENVDDLLLKLSKFTNIDIDNFSKESVIHWREKTQYGIDTIVDI